MNANKLLVLSDTIPYARTRIGMSLEAIISLATSCSALFQSLEGYVIEEINKLPSVLTLSISSGVDNIHELSTALLDIGTTESPKFVAGAFTMHFLIDPSAACPDFHPTKWIARWNALVLSGDTSTAGASECAIDMWIAYWKPLLEYALDRTQRTVPDSRELQGIRYTKSAINSMPESINYILNCPISVQKGISRVRTDYRNGAPASAAETLMWGGEVHTNGVYLISDTGTLLADADVDDSIEENVYK